MRLMSFLAITYEHNAKVDTHTQWSKQNQNNIFNIKIKNKKKYCKGHIHIISNINVEIKCNIVKK